MKLGLAARPIALVGARSALDRQGIPTERAASSDSIGDSYGGGTSRPGAVAAPRGLTVEVALAWRPASADR
jgi:hypothetical protein